MLSFDDVLERIDQGPICIERDFDLRVLYPKLQEVIKEHDIRFDPDNPIPSDDDLADEIFEAALELYLHTGTLCIDNNRRALFQESEIKDSLKGLPTRLLFGEGADQHAMVYRRIEDTQEPFCMSESIGHTVSEENYLPVIMSYAQNPLADAAGVASTTTIRGRPVRARSPTEVEAAIWNVLCFRHATKMVGRPGLGSIDLIGNAESTTAIIAATNPDFGARKTDGFAVAGLPELKVDYERLNKTAYFLRTGHLICSLAPGPIKGGLAGGPKMIPAGSTAVRQTIEKYQPLIGLHGHIHESRGVNRIGRTLCLNPGSEYGEGILRGAIITLDGNKVKTPHLTSG